MGSHSCLQQNCEEVAVYGVRAHRPYTHTHLHRYQNTGKLMCITNA